MKNITYKNSLGNGLYLSDLGDAVEISAIAVLQVFGQIPGLDQFPKFPVFV